LGVLSQGEAAHWLLALGANQRPEDLPTVLGNGRLALPELYLSKNHEGEGHMKFLQQGMAVFVSLCLLLTGVPKGFASQADPSVSSSPPQAAQQSTEQLQQLVAPIALYPDALIAQILAAATYPDQIVEAEKWLEKHKHLEGEKLAKEADKEKWDPAVKALIQFPAVLANMNQNLAWTSELGDAYVNQQPALNQAVQAMRQRAQRAGNLETTPQDVSDHLKTYFSGPAKRAAQRCGSA
jgi:hypothetical protein